MLQNKLVLSIILCFLSIGSAKSDEDAKKVKATLGEATVFFNGAELVHKATATVARGVNEVWITELSPGIDVNSLKISTTKGVIIASHEYSLDFMNRKGLSTVEKQLKDSVKFYKKKISEYEISSKTNDDLLELLKANKSIGGAQTGLNVTDLMKVMDYYKAQSNTLNRAQRELEEKVEKEKEALDRVETQLRQESAKNVKSMGVLKLSITSPLTTTTDFTVTYYTRNANWVPYYDINVPGTGEQIKIASKAKVGQTTGLDWTKVKLTLSTATPSINKEAPLFDAWFLDFQHDVINPRQMLTGSVARQSMHSYDKVVQNSMASLEEKSMRAMGSGSTAESQPLYIINGVPASNEEFASLSPDMIDNFEILKAASATSLYGAGAANGVMLITTKSLNDFVKRDEGELNAVYNIDLPYTIQGNGKVQNIDLQTNSVSAEFKHYAVPKLDSEVFVLAEIEDWHKLGLLSGKASITFDGTYVGETALNVGSIAKNLTLTLGTDKRVIVKREKLQDYSSQKFLGRDTRQDFAYKISVKNNQNRPVKMVLKDQYPISKQKDIQVEMLKETTPTTHINEEVGVLNWEFELDASETKEFRVAYTVKYPKDKNLSW